MYKSENQIWADIMTLINGGLAYFNITGWTVRQGQLPTKTTVNKPTIYIDRITSRRYGWQKKKDYVENGQMKHKESYIQELRFQVSSIKKRNVEIIDNMTSADVSNYLVSYLSSTYGLKVIRDLGYQPLRTVDVGEPAFINDSDNYEKNPNFDISLYLVQDIIKDENGIKDFTINIERV